MATKTGFIAVATLFLGLTNGHSWVEEYQVISSDGLYTGNPGYSRGYVSREMFPALHNGDKSMNYEIPASIDPGRIRINASDPVCMPSQRTSNYTNPSFPKLTVSPGDFVAMKYLENGHVTLPWTLPGKPELGGTIFVYGTTQPSTDEKLVDVLEWTADGKGGNGKGFLMSAQNFDDGRCYQMNSCVLSAERQALSPNLAPGQTSGTGLEQWCESDVQVPATLQPGTLTTYWVWQWLTKAEADCNYFDGKDEYYTTCADFDVITPVKIKQKLLGKPAVSSARVQDNAQTAAVKNWASRTALVPAPVMNHITTPAPIAGRAATTTSANASFWASCSSIAAHDAAIIKAGGLPPAPPACPSGKWATGALFASISASIKALQKQVVAATSTATSATTTAPPEVDSDRMATVVLTTLVTVVRTIIATGLPPSSTSTSTTSLSTLTTSSAVPTATTTSAAKLLVNKLQLSTIAIVTEPSPTPVLMTSSAPAPAPTSSAVAATSATDNDAVCGADD